MDSSDNDSTVYSDHDEDSSAEESVLFSDTTSTVTSDSESIESEYYSSSDSELDENHKAKSFVLSTKEDLLLDFERKTMMPGHVGTVSEMDDYKISVNDLPDSTSKWPRNQESRRLVFRLFKTRRFKVDVEKILWPEQGTAFTKIFDKLGKAQICKEFREYFNVCLAPIDIDVHEWFFEDVEGSPVLKSEAMLRAQTKRLMEDLLTIEPEFNEENSWIVRMKSFMPFWTGFCMDMLLTDPSVLNEEAYEDLFRAFLQMFGLCCRNGAYRKMEIQYPVWKEDGRSVSDSVRSKPDLIVTRVERSPSSLRLKPLAVVQVKALVLPGGWKRHKRGTAARELSSSQQEEKVKALEVVNQPEKRAKYEHCDKIGGEKMEQAVPDREESLADAVAAASVEQDASTSRALCGSADVRVRGWNASSAAVKQEAACPHIPPEAEIPSKEEKKEWNRFLPQLLGEAVAVGALNKADGRHTCLGIAVIGYEVFFVNFSSQSSLFFQIPMTSGAGMDIFVSEKFSLLKKADRDKIFNILLYMTEML